MDMGQFNGLAEFVGFFLLTGLGWFVNRLHDQVDDLNKRLIETREEYVHREQLKEMNNHVLQRIDRIEALLIEFMRGSNK